MKVDAGSVFSMAALSLLTGVCPCTAPTEGAEIRKRAGDLWKILVNHGHTLHYYCDSLFPSFEDSAWPFATDRNKLSLMMFDFIEQHFKSKEINRHMDTKSFREVLESIPEIEEKYRLSKVKDNVILEVALPF